MKLLSWLSIRRSRRPVSAHSGRKEFIEAIEGASLQADAVLSADTEAP